MRFLEQSSPPRPPPVETVVSPSGLLLPGWDDARDARKTLLVRSPPWSQIFAFFFVENLHFGLYSTQIRWYTATSIFGEILLKNGLGCHISKKCATLSFWVGAFCPTFPR